MPANSYPTPGSSALGRKNKIVNAMKRSFSSRPTKSDVRLLFSSRGQSGLTIEQDARDGSLPHLHYEERAGRLPTVEQISMGLHLSRTPHIRSTNGRGRSMSSELPTKPDAKPARSRATIPLPKPALKKITSLSTPTSATPSFTNVSTSTSTTPSSTMLRIDRRNSFFTPRLFSRVTKIIPSSQGRPPREVKPDPETSSPKKLVRFSVDSTE